MYDDDPDPAATQDDLPELMRWIGIILATGIIVVSVACIVFASFGLEVNFQ